VALARMIEARGLGIEVPGVAGRKLLAALSISLGAGDCCALLGRNGSGKSSLIAVLAGLRRPAAGTVEMEGRPLGAWHPRERARALGVLLQDEPGDYWGTTREYVRLGRYPHGDGNAADGAHGSGESHVAEVLEELDLGAHADQRYRSLSGGERQRARIAQLLAQDPRILLLDEPLQHLDLAHQARVMDALAARARRGKCVLMALHEPAMAARHCARAVLLYDSDRIAQGPAKTLLTQQNLESLYRCRLEAAGSFVPAGPAVGLGGAGQTANGPTGNGQAGNG
jgi:iron complex transport system ATP-binding protein